MFKLDFEKAQEPEIKLSKNEKKEIRDKCPHILDSSASIATHQECVIFDNQEIFVSSNVT